MDKDNVAEQVAGNTAAGEPKILLVTEAGLLEVTEG